MDELELFTEALNRTDPAERAVFLDQACAGNPELRVRIDALLAGHDQSLNPLDRPAVPADDRTENTSPATALVTGQLPPEIEATTIDRGDTDATLTASQVPTSRTARNTTDKAIGTVIAGRYTLVEVIGQGGMGSVYRASQTEPVKRQVALKLIKTGMDSRSVLARFDAERQALALMDHPNIARIYDGGVTTDGQPFFVMELVNGVPLTDYCDQKRLSVNDRLELFVSICQAVQHAHQKGIIHRDLKPSNVLVTEVDGRPTPKVIDFGVAKATEQRLTDMSFADTGAIVGTPTYMSPEQADPTTMDIDTRTDVYALGVILYELLTGSPPLDSKQFQRGAILEMLRMVREVDPPRPSTRLSTADALPNIAANRNIEPARLANLLQGELDWVVMKALEKDRTRRYDTANGFARDIQRYLADEVVEARPPSRGYRFKKFVKRNKVQVVAASLVALTLVGGIVGTSLGMLAARRARDAEAEQRLIANDERDKAIEAEKRTAVERDKALAAEARTKTINDFLTNDLLTQAEPANNAAEDKVTLLEVLDRAAEKVGTRFADQPELGESLRATIAQTYHGLASWEKAETQWRAVLDSVQKRDPKSPFVYLAQSHLAHILRHRGRQDAEVLKMAKESAEGLERKLGPDHPTTIGSMEYLAQGYRDAGQFDKALIIFERTYDRRRTMFGPDNLSTLTSMGNLVLTYRDVGQLNKALPLGEEALALTKAKLGPDHPETLTIMSVLAVSYRDAGQIQKALPLFEETLALSKTRLGPDHPLTLISMNNMAGGYRDSGQLAKAVLLNEEAFTLMKAKFGPDHLDTLEIMSNMAASYWSLNRLEKSVPLFEELMRLREKKLGRPHLHTQRTIANLGVNYKDTGRLTEAIPLLEEAYRSSRRLSPLRWVGIELIEAYVKSGKRDEAFQLIENQLAEARRSLPKDSVALANTLSPLSLSLVRLGASADAESLIREVLEIREKTQPDEWNTFTAKALLGRSLLGQKKYAEAEPLLLTGYEGMKEREATIPEHGKIRLPEALDHLIELYTATNRPDEVKKWQAERGMYPAAQTPKPGEKK